MDMFITEILHDIVVLNFDVIAFAHRVPLPRSMYVRTTLGASGRG